MERRLTPAEATSATAIQREIDLVARAGRAGGRVILPRLELELDRGLQLRTGVELLGQGEATVLRKAPGRTWPLSGYHNYGMQDVPLKSSAGLAVGMTVSVHDSRTHGGFYETFATITWIDGDWVGLDHGIQADYAAEAEPCLTNAHPLVFGHEVRDAAVRDLTLEGGKDSNPVAMGGCRGAAVYLANSRDVEVSGVRERAFRGEGLGFQMCRDITIRDCRFDDNTGNGLHPGAGSTNALFTGCGSQGNARAGFFFCVRANHVTVRQCRFTGNGTGISIGTRDCHNLVEDCLVEANRGPGVLVRSAPAPTEVHSCRVRRCTLRGNAAAEGGGQVEIGGPAHDLIFDGNTIDGSGTGKAGICAGPDARGIWLEANVCSDCSPDVAADPAALAAQRPVFDCGFGDWPTERFRHLRTA